MISVSDYKLKFFIVSVEGQIKWRATMIDEFHHIYDGYGPTMLEATEKCIEQIGKCDDNWTVSAESCNE